MRVLILVPSLDTNKTSGAKVNLVLIESLESVGYKIDIIDLENLPFKSFNLFFFLSRLQRYIFRYFTINIGDYFETKVGFSFNYFNDKISYKKAIKNLDPNDFDMIWTLGQGTNFNAHAAVLDLSQWHNKWYAYVHDPYPQHLYPRPFNFIERGYKQKRRFFRQVTLKAKRLVFPSLMLKQWMQSYFTALEGKSLIIPHQKNSIQIPNNSVLPDYFDKEKFNILHAGNFLNLRDPKPLVEAFKLFLIKQPDAKDDSSLIFLGKPSKFDYYLKQNIKTLNNIYLSKGLVNFKETFLLQQKASVNVILEAQSEISPFLPGKFPHCIQAGQPILLIGPYYSECKRLLGEHYSCAFDFNEIEALSNKIEELYLIWKKGQGFDLNYDNLKSYFTGDYMKQIIEKDKII